MKVIITHKFECFSHWIFRLCAHNQEKDPQLTALTSSLCGILKILHCCAFTALAEGAHSTFTVWLRLQGKDDLGLSQEKTPYFSFVFFPGPHLLSFSLYGQKPPLFLHSNNRNPGIYLGQITLFTNLPFFQKKIDKSKLTTLILVERCWPDSNKYSIKNSDIHPPIGSSSINKFKLEIYI